MNNQAAQLQLLGMQAGAVRPLQVGDQRVMSGLRKHATRGPVAVSALGLAGDEQADLTVHGGPAKAVYAYPVEHHAFWREHRRAHGLSTDLPYGSLGENLTLIGVLEASLYVGDELRFPDCVLRVTQPEPERLDCPLHAQRQARKDGQITLRWIAGALSDAKGRFRKLRGHRDMRTLLAALKAKSANVTDDGRKARNITNEEPSSGRVQQRPGHRPIS